MLSKLHQINYIDAIVDQVSNMQFDSKRISLNRTDGNLMSGDYEVLPEFVNTPLGKLLNELGDIGEARLLCLESGDTYTAHTDPDDRLHLAITTNPDCYIIDLDSQQLYHLPVDGQVWHMDTSVRHTACNWGGRSRIHLNIRYKLPKFSAPGWNLKISGGSFDWKQELYDGLMSYFNKQIKCNAITGFEKVNEKELNLNCTAQTLREITSMITQKGFVVTGNPVTQTDRWDC